jgi:hypothetical protein
MVSIFYGVLYSPNIPVPHKNNSPLFVIAAECELAHTLTIK